MAAVSASFLAIAMLVPLRDDRRGRRATLLGRAPFRPLFPSTKPDVTSDAPIEDAHGPHERESERDARNPPQPAHRFSALARRAFGAAFGGRRARSDERPLLDDPVSTVALTTDGRSDDVEFRSFEDELALIGHTATDFAEPPMETPPEAIDPCDDLRSITSSASATSPNRLAPESPEEDPLFRDVSALVVHANDRIAFGRSRPPLTRLPLRSVHVDVTWPRELPEPHRTWSAEERHRFLQACARGAEPIFATALQEAWREEIGAGRLLALRALARASIAESNDVFVDALTRGTDDERAFAVDVFADRGDAARLVDALSDRLDAIAARAALALVGNGTRADFESALCPHVERARLDAILGLLAAVIA
jgi:hypothetical protein